MTPTSSISPASHTTSPLTNLPIDPVESAEMAGLRYVHDTSPGITRKREGDHFIYFGVDGKQITDETVLARIKSLAIPPAYSDVWICRWANGHLQATGRDAKGRKQYRYHPRWREVRDGSKYERIIDFADALPRIRAQVGRDLREHGLRREKILAVVVQLLETGRIRIGNEEYARVNNSFGLTTLRSRHVDVEGMTIHFHFRGKSGKVHSIDIKDSRLARIVRRCQELPGQDLFEYLDEQGNIHPITSTDVNAYLHQIAGHEFTAKDFRTWAGTVIAATSLAECTVFENQSQAKKNIVRAIEQVAEYLGNTPAISRKSYIHPVVLEAYLDGTLVRALAGYNSKGEPAESYDLVGEESAVAALLRERLSR